MFSSRPLDCLCSLTCFAPAAIIPIPFYYAARRWPTSALSKVHVPVIIYGFRKSASLVDRGRSVEILGLTLFLPSLQSSTDPTRRWPISGLLLCSPTSSRVSFRPDLSRSNSLARPLLSLPLVHADLTSLAPLPLQCTSRSGTSLGGRSTTTSSRPVRPFTLAHPEHRMFTLLHHLLSDPPTSFPAFGAGVALCGLFIFIALENSNLTPKWWGVSPRRTYLSALALARSFPSLCLSLTPPFFPPSSARRTTSVSTDATTTR